MENARITVCHAIFWLSQNTRKPDFDKYCKEMIDQLVGEELESDKVTFITTGTPIRWEKNIIRLTLEIYGAVCETSEFIINGIPADAYDFGNKTDEGIEYAQDYCCGNMIFRTISATPKILDKYNINDTEYNEVAAQLADKLSFGNCGWCS